MTNPILKPNRACTINPEAAPKQIISIAENLALFDNFEKIAMPTHKIEKIIPIANIISGIIEFMKIDILNNIVL